MNHEPLTTRRPNSPTRHKELEQLHERLKQQTKQLGQVIRKMERENVWELEVNVSPRGVEILKAGNALADFNKECRDLLREPHPTENRYTLLSLYIDVRDAAGKACRICPARTASILCSIAATSLNARNYDDPISDRDLVKLGLMAPCELPDFTPEQI